MTTTVAVHPINGRVRQVLLEILDAEPLRPWHTTALQHAFAPANWPRVYVILRNLAKSGHALTWQIPTDRHRWWSSATVQPLCLSCDRPAARLVRTWGPAGGWVCGQPGCLVVAVATRWPWDEPSELVVDV